MSEKAKCLWCGRLFPAGFNRKYCSDECKKNAKRERNKKYLKKYRKKSAEKDVAAIRNVKKESEAKKKRHCVDCGQVLPARNWRRCAECKKLWRENYGDYLLWPGEIQHSPSISELRYSYMATAHR